MLKILLLSLLSTFFVACSSTTALEYFKKDELEARVIQYSKKADIVYNNEQKVLFWATYLNNIKNKEYKNDTFIISVYFTDSQNHDLKENDYLLSLNNNKPISIKEIHKNDKEYNKLIVAKWGKHYLVEFKELNRVYNLKLKLEKPNYAKTQLDFVK